MNEQDPPSTPAPRRSLRRTLVVAPLRALGWLVLVLWIFALVVNGTDFCRQKLESELARRLNTPGSTITLGAVHVNWLGPGLTVEDLRVKMGDREHLHIEHIYVAASLSQDGDLVLNRIDVDRGRVLISEVAVKDLRALMNTPGQEDSGPIQLPSVQVRNLQIELEVPRMEPAVLGNLDLSMRAQPDAPSKITGRVVLPTVHGDARVNELFLSGMVELDGELELHALTDELDIEAWDTPKFPFMSQLRALSPRGRLSMHTIGNLSLTGDLMPRASVRLRMDGGSLKIPTVSRAVEGLQLELSCLFEPEAQEGFWAPRAWTGSGRLDGLWDGQELRAGLRIGESARPGLALEGWLQAPDFDLRTPAATALENPELIPILYRAIEPNGHAKVSVGFTCADTIQPSEELWPAIELSVLARSRGKLNAAFHGLPETDRPDLEPMSFAMPAVIDETLVVYAHNKRFPRHELVDLRFEGNHPTGRVRGSYQQWSNPVDMPPFAPGYGRAELDLFVEVPEIEINQELNEFLPRETRVPELGTLFEDYGVDEGGWAKVLIRVCERAERPKTAVQVEVHLHDMDAAYKVLPVPIHNVEARILAIDNGRDVSSVSFLGTGETDSCSSVSMAARVRSEGLTPGTENRLTRFDLVDIVAEGLDLRGSDLEVAALSYPEALEAVEQFAPSGSVDFHFVRTSRLGAEIRDWAEITPRGNDLVLRPLVFPMRCAGVRGRVLLDVWEPPVALDGDQGPGEPSTRSSTRIAPIVATWRDEIPVAFHANFPSGADAAGLVVGAGLRPSDHGLLTDIAEALGADPDELLADLEPYVVGGAIDFDYEFRLPEGPEKTEDLFHFRLRENDLVERNGLEINRLQGTLQLREGRLQGPHLEAHLGETPVDLYEIEVMLTEGAVRAEADIRADDVTIDARLLSQFLDDQAVASLVEDFGLRGTLDLDKGHMSLKFGPDSVPELTLRGEATLSDAFLAIKVPISIRSARITLEELFLQGDDIRGWGRVEDLYGQAVGRDLAQTNLLLSYYNSQLTVDSLEGLFCRGRIRGLGQSSPGVVSEPVVSIDLHPPHRFQTGVAFSEVEIGTLLENVFASDIADRGLLSGKFKLSGELDDLFGVRGSGYGRITKTVLWSVPVVRDLFSQLGFDDTALFDQMETDFRVANGEIQMDGMRVHSPLLNLRGSGTLGFDGTLNHHLEITYSLVDKTGPLSELIYWLQNNLLAIAVRGDMSRPKIIPLGLFSNPFVSKDDTWRALPSPDYSDLPERF